MSDFITKDSGQRQSFETGSVRDLATGKGRFDLIPTGPLRRLAELYERGAAKYGDNNWQKGQPLQRYIDSAMRHLNELRAGETTEDHAIGVVWNMFSYIWTVDELAAGRLPASLDNRPPCEARYQPAPRPLDDIANVEVPRMNLPTNRGATSLAQAMDKLERMYAPSGPSKDKECVVCAGPHKGAGGL